MNLAAARRHLEALKGVFIDRYNSADPADNSGLVLIDAAIKAGADADFEGLRESLVGYNLYAHHEALALAEIASAEAALAPDVEDEEDAQPAVSKPLAQQNKTELLATAAERKVKVPDGATVAELRAALAPAGFEVSKPIAETFSATEGATNVEIAAVTEPGDEQPDADLVNTRPGDQPSADVVNSIHGGSSDDVTEPADEDSDEE